MLEVRLSRRAIYFLNHESDYLMERSPSAASSLMRRFQKAFDNLSHFPNLGMHNDGFPLKKSFRLIVGDYVMNYELDDFGILITNIRHGRQEPIDIANGDDL